MIFWLFFGKNHGLYIAVYLLFLVFRLLEVDSELVKRPTFHKLLVFIKVSEKRERES